LLLLLQLQVPLQDSWWFGSTIKFLLWLLLLLLLHCSFFFCSCG
jgi:hypothetical protein